MSHKPDKLNLDASIQEVCKRLASQAVQKDTELGFKKAEQAGHTAQFGLRSRVTSLGDRKHRSGHKPEHTEALLEESARLEQLEQAQAVVDAAAVDGFISEGGQ
jgi:hypothetical protein